MRSAKRKEKTTWIHLAALQMLMKIACESPKRLRPTILDIGQAFSQQLPAEILKFVNSQRPARTKAKTRNEKKLLIKELIKITLRAKTEGISIAETKL